MSNATRYFEDLEVTTNYSESSVRTITEQEIVDFAALYDPQYFHADAVAAKDSRFGSVIASGIQVMAIWRALDHEIAQDIAWICGVAWNNVRWHNAVRPGDQLRARARCTEKRVSDSDATRGVVTIDYQLMNQHDHCVWSCESINLVERRTSDDL
ncbi:MAG: MaoC/PaaZ C-terminal domain-containing protein [Gammaproteobacteria bacterium]